MRQPPRSIIHINFTAGALVFDARPIWTAATNAESLGKLPKLLASQLSADLGPTAIHLGTRHYVMKRAISELKIALEDVYNLVPEPWAIPDTRGFRVVSGKNCELARDRVLLAIDSFLFEFRAFLDLLAQFAYRFLVEIGKQPASRQVLSDGKQITITSRGNKTATARFSALSDKCARHTKGLV
jgi:hypothetical protein